MKKNNSLLTEKIKKYIFEIEEDRVTSTIKKLLSSINIKDEMYCGYKIIPPSKNEKTFYYLDKKKVPYIIQIVLLGGEKTKFFPRTQAIYNRQEDIEREVFNTIYKIMGIAVSMSVKYVSSCEKSEKYNIHESHHNEINIPQNLKRIINFKKLDEYVEKSLNNASERYELNKKKWKAINDHKFNLMVVSNLIEIFMSENFEHYYENYDILWNFFTEYCFNKSKERFNEIKNSV